jgi:cyclophilin family peptidyl-prolyl cis-trans isomerase
MGIFIIRPADRFLYSPINSFRSQFYITFKPTPNLNKKHTVFGKLVGGEDVLDALEKLPLKDGTERPAKPVRITEVVMCDIRNYCPNKHADSH